MRQIVVSKFGGLEGVQLEDKPNPQPKPGEILIRSKAAGVNYCDLLCWMGAWPHMPEAPGVPGVEVAGVVEAVGDGVDAAWKGKEVIAVMCVGGYSELLCVPQNRVFEKPSNISFEEAASIPLKYATAYVCLVHRGAMQKDERVFIHNIGGGVGLAGVNLAKHFGAELYGTASEHKHDFLKKQGVKHLIDYNKEDWVAALKKITNDEGVDIILDCLGSVNLDNDLEVLRSLGRFAFFGMFNDMVPKDGQPPDLQKVMTEAKINPYNIMFKNTALIGVSLGAQFNGAAPIRDWMATLLEGAKDGWLKPCIAETFPIEKWSEAHYGILGRKNIGSYVLTF